MTADSEAMLTEALSAGDQTTEAERQAFRVKFRYTANGPSQAHKWLVENFMTTTPAERLSVPSEAQSIPGQPIPEDMEPEEPKK